MLYWEPLYREPTVQTKREVSKGHLSHLKRSPPRIIQFQKWRWGSGSSVTTRELRRPIATFIQELQLPGLQLRELRRPQQLLQPQPLQQPQLRLRSQVRLQSQMPVWSVWPVWSTWTARSMMRVTELIAIVSTWVASLGTIGPQVGDRRLLYLAT